MGKEKRQCVDCIMHYLHQYCYVSLIHVGQTSNSIDSYLVFVLNVASIVHCKVGDDLDSNNDNINGTNAIFLNGKNIHRPTLDGCFSGWDTNWINHRGCGPRRCGQDTFGPTIYGPSRDGGGSYLLMLRRN